MGGGMTNPSAVVALELLPDLVTLGYLGRADMQNHAKVTRAIKRFQRHAARPYRMPQPDIAPTFTHAADGVCDEVTAAEIRLWVQKKWRLPIGRFQLTTLNVGTNPVRLRQDAATAWSAIVGQATSKGATLGGQYGDSARAIRPTSKAGASHYSFHYCGRAVDIAQEFTLSASHRYYVVKEAQGPATFWRIWCKTDKQDGSQGVEIKKHTKKWYDFKPATENWFPPGYYVDLTAIIESTNQFERIHAQNGWQGTYNKAEWWHFQYKLGKQPTFLDEMELIGVDEARLRACGWTTDAMLDHAPG
jgi:hypothetical protein